MESHMVTLGQLWLPVVLSTIGVFFASSLVHMVFKWHNSDYRPHPDEERVRAALGQQPPGQYVVPHCPDMKQMRSPEMQKKFSEGPVAWILVQPTGLPRVGASLGQWFGLNAVISVIIAYLASHALPSGVSFLGVCRFAGGCAFLAHAAGAVTGAIWMGHPWRVAIKHVLDALIYATVTALVFGALWPVRA